MERSKSVSDCGLHGSENDGMSSEKCERNTLTVNLRFPGEGSSTQG